MKIKAYVYAAIPATNYCIFVLQLMLSASVSTACAIFGFSTLLVKPSPKSISLAHKRLTWPRSLHLRHWYLCVSVVDSGLGRPDARLKRGAWWRRH